MNPRTRALFTKAELDLLDATAPAALAPLGHQELVALSHRVRKAADKYRDLYRRQGHASVERAHSRAKTQTANQSTAQKAEVFSQAMSRVSSALAKLDRQQAAELRSERMVAEKAAKPRPKRK